MRLPEIASAAAAVALVAAALVGCGDDERPSSSTASAGTSAATTTTSTDASPGTTAAPAGPGARTTTRARGPAAAGGRERRGARDDTPPPSSWDATCPTATTSPMGCRAVRGRVLSIQSYDPDGDGDLHVVAIGGDVTLPGITVFDVRASLRPRRDPVKGEYVTGAGPVFRGSLKQRQIQVDTFRVWRPRR